MSKTCSYFSEVLISHR